MADDKFRAEFDYEICNSRVRPLADALVKKYSELHHIDIDKILFITNHKSGGGRKTLLLAKTGIVLASLLAGALGYLWLRWLGRTA